MKTLKHILVLVSLSITFSITAQEYASVDVNIDTEMTNSRRSIVKETISYNTWSKMLRRNSSVMGAVNYSAFKNEYREFNKILKKLAETNVSSRWSRKAQLAHWINVYNAYSIKLIADHFPAKNLSDIGKVEKIQFFEINHEMMSLKDIEEIIESFGEARALLVLHRGAVGDIRIDKDAYTAENLEETLEVRVRVFVNNKTKNKITTTSAKLSPLFKKYKKQIEDQYNDTRNFLERYSKVDMNYGQKIEYLPYNDTIDSFQEVF